MGGGITKLNSNAFTLIELLAIIVILAIIAVITVPIILNIIENSRKGAAVDSAYGYKDSVNKTYIAELSKPNQGGLKLNGIYEVQDDGTLEPADGYSFGVTNYNALPVSVSGDKPSSGTLTYENNVLKSGYLVIGDYRVTYSNGTFTAVKTSLASNGQGVSETQNSGSTVADITVDDYGTYINIGTDLLGKNNTTESDWRVFSKDSNGAWLILTNYLPVKEETVGSQIVDALGLGIVDEYGVYGSNREDFLSNINGDWSGLITGSDIVGETGVLVKGTVDLPTWVNSWNASYTDDIIYAVQDSEADDDGLYEWYVGLSENPNSDYSNSANLSGKTGYSNTLYFPNLSDQPGYWLASPINSEDVVLVDEFLGKIDSHFPATDNGYGVRPVVYLPNNISLDTTQTVWTIAD